MRLQSTVKYARGSEYGDVIVYILSWSGFLVSIWGIVVKHGQTQLAGLVTTTRNSGYGVNDVFIHTSLNYRIWSIDVVIYGNNNHSKIFTLFTRHIRNDKAIVLSSKTKALAALLH